MIPLPTDPFVHSPARPHSPDRYTTIAQRYGTPGKNTISSTKQSSTFPQGQYAYLDIDSIFLIVLNIFTIYHNSMAGILISVNNDNRVL